MGPLLGLGPTGPILARGACPWVPSTLCHPCPLPPWVPSGRWDAEVDRRPKGARGARVRWGPAAGTASRSANPVPFPRIPQGDIILWCFVCELCQRLDHWGR